MKLRVRWQTKWAEFSYPLGRPPRTAVLGTWFRSSGNVRAFPNGWNSDAAAFAPQAIVGTWDQFHDLIARGIVAPERCVIVIHRSGQSLLSPAQRDRVWRAFRVPVFEQILGEGGNLIAAECEAHNGLHMNGLQDLDGYVLDSLPCGCGNPSRRIVPAKVTEDLRVMTAAAG